MPRLSLSLQLHKHALQIQNTTVSCTFNLSMMNRSKAQAFEEIYSYLPKPVFSHGQLHFILSKDFDQLSHRVLCPSRTRMLIVFTVKHE
jgi:hypothetical protein